MRAYRILAQITNRDVILFVQPIRHNGVVFILFLFLVGVAASACRGRANIEISEEELALREEVLASIDHADPSDFLNSFDQVSSYEFDRYIRTEQYDDDDFLIAFDEYLVRLEGKSGQRTTHIERADSAGEFDFGFFNRFVSENVDSADPVDLIPYVLPDDLGYQDPRNVDKYLFRFRPDTLLWDRQAHVIEIKAKPDLADGLNVRLVRQFIDVESNKLVGVYLERVDLALLFREESEFYVDLKPGPGEVFLPYNTRFQTKIGTPFRGTYKIRTVSTFSDYR